MFHVRDQTLGEDACRVRKQSAPIVFSTLRNIVLNLMQRIGVSDRPPNSGACALILSRPCDCFTYENPRIEKPCE